MKRIELLRQVHQLDPDLTIYAKAPWCADSEAATAVEPEDVLVPEPLASQGLSYFLEIHIARDVVPDLSGLTSLTSLEHWCGRLVRYAMDDA